MVTNYQQKQVEKLLFSNEWGDLNFWKINLAYKKILGELK